MTIDVIDNSYLPDLAKLYVDTYNAPPWNDHWTEDSAYRKLSQMCGYLNSFGLVAKDENGKMLGMIIGESEIWYSGTHFYIRDFFVSHMLQGQGIGSALLNEFEARLTQMGVTKVYLFTSRKDQTEGFYQNRGYSSWNSMVMMGKPLGDQP